jgi:aminoglycoside phosphotransferase (APT) family kinase protein
METPKPHDPDHAPDGERLAEDLAGFVGALRAIDGAGAPRSSRDRPLAVRDPEARTALAALAALPGTIDTDAAAAAWEDALGAPAWDGSTTWTHGDLLPPNLLVDAAGRLTAVLDWGNAGAGDPVVDVLPAWSVLGPGGRAAFRASLDVDGATWRRARGMALHQALLIIPYYRVTNPAFAAMARRTVAQVVADHALDA